MANISLTAASLLDAAKKMEDAANRIDAAINKIDGAMENLSAVWNDQNSQTYLRKYTALKEENFEEFKRAAHDYSTFLKAVVDAYQKEFIEPTSSSVN